MEGKRGALYSMQYSGSPLLAKRAAFVGHQVAWHRMGTQSEVEPVESSREPMEDQAQEPERMMEDQIGVGRVHQRKPGSQAHFCITCSFPVAVFGRLYPCLHAFCIACASDMADCYMWVLCCHLPDQLG